MKRRVGNSGFTIVETMIVLAVTGALFAMIALTLSGRQRSNEFIQSINDVRTRIQQSISETQSGYYANAGNFSCSQSASKVLIGAAGSTGQGQNSSCVFLGKVLQFTSGGSTAGQVRVYPVTALRIPPIPGNLSSADPSVVNNGTNDASTTFNLKYGLRVAAMKADGTALGAFGVLSSIDSSNPGESGDQQFDVYGVTSVSLTSSEILDSTDLALSKNPQGGVKICFTSGGTDQYGLITVGNKGGQVSVDLNIMNKTGGGPPCGI